ncbi:MAG: hypothetical protein C0483_14645 [Pirellula sp.]|nr:hypothetical protein [Pirellula sp.]
MSWAWRGRAVGYVAACLLGVASVPHAFAAMPATETLLPASTRTFVSVRSVKHLREALDKTKLGTAADDKELKPFLDDLKAQVDARLAETANSVGLSIGDFKDLSDGEVTFTVVDLGSGATGTAVIADVTGHDQQLAAVRGKIATALAQHKAAPTPYASQAGAQGTKYDIPPPKVGAPPIVMVEAAHKTADGVIWIVSDNEVLSELISASLGGGPPADTLAKVDAFQKIMTQTKPPAGEPAANLAVFVDPLGLAYALRAYEHPPQKVKPDPLEVFKNAGFDGMKGVGGQAVLGVGDYGVLARAAAIAPKPLQKSMQMLSFQKGSDFAPQAWVRSNVTAYATLYLDPLQSFDNFDPIFDGFLEDEGIWKEVIKSLEVDEDGPQIKLRDEFFGQLGNRVTFVVDKKEPITEDSSQLVVAVNLKGADEAATKAASDRVAETLRKAFANDETVEKVSVEIPGGKLDAWRVKIEEEVPPQAANQEGVVNGMRTVASALVTVHSGHLFMASDVDSLQKVLTPSEKPGLEHATDFVATAEKIGGIIQTLGPEPTIIALGFQRADELMRIDYELFKAGKLAGGKTLLGRLADLILRKAADEGKPVKGIDPSKLPPFDSMRKYLSPMAIVINETADGIFATGFSLEKIPTAAPASAEDK